MKNIVLALSFILLVGMTCNLYTKQLPGKKNNFDIGEVKYFQSSIYKKSKKLQIFLPKNYKLTHTNYPVLFVLDGNVHFHYTTGIVQLISGVEIPSLIVVGIPNRFRFDDATPSKDPRYPRGGGAEKYLEFLEKDVIPFIDKNYRTEKYRILAGHSLDGLTVVYSFLYKSGLFNSYIANSPSLWWDKKKLVLEASKAPVFKFSNLRTIFFSNGDKDSSKLIKGVDIFKKLLKEQPGKNLAWKNKVFLDSSHGDSAIKGMYDGLKYIFDRYFFLNKSHDIALVKKHFIQLKSRYGYEIKIPELYIKQLGYQALMREKKPKKAINVFKINSENYPHSADAHDCLGEAYEADNQLDKANNEFELAVKFGKIEKNNLEIYKKNLSRVIKKLQ